jgi:hypothetical protein
MKLKNGTIIVALLVPSAAAAQDPALSGCWTTQKEVLQYGDGKRVEREAKCTLRFAGRTIVSECLGDDAYTKITYGYRILGPGKYEATVLHNSRNPSAISSEQYLYQIEGETLQITVSPISARWDRNMPNKVESVSVRAACPPAAY